MIPYYVLLLGQLVLGLYDDAALCARAAAEQPGSVCVLRTIR
jgi:hypothetical protein